MFRNVYKCIIMHFDSILEVAVCLVLVLKIRASLFPHLGQLMYSYFTEYRINFLNIHYSAII